MQDTIKIKDKDYFIHINPLAWSKWEQATGLVVKQTDMEKLTINQEMVLIHEMLREGHRQAKKKDDSIGEFKLSIEDIYELADGFPLLNHVLNYLTDKEKKQLPSSQKS